MRLAACVAAALAVACALTGSAAAGERRPASYLIPGDGVIPEGITVAPDGTFYVTSVGGGAIFRGHVTEPRMRVFVPAGSDGRTAAGGIHLDPRSRLFVAGAANDDGVLYVYDRDGRLLARRDPPRRGALLNDLTFTRDAVYVTDSRHQVIYRAALHGSEIGPLESWLALGPHSPAPPETRFLNGIVTSAGGRFLIATDLFAEVLFRIDTRTRAVSVIDLEGEEFGGDGMLLEGRNLYGVVWDRQPDGTFTTDVRAVRLTRDLGSGRVVARVADPRLVDPTTLARDGDRLLVVNSQLQRAPGTPPFTVSAIPDPLR